MKTPTQNAAAALMLACDCIIEAAQAGGTTGTPTGPLYAALMGHGMKLDTFNSILSALTQAGKIRKEGVMIYPPLRKISELAEGEEPRPGEILQIM